MPNVPQADFAYKAPDGSLGQVRGLTSSDLSLINSLVQKVSDLKVSVPRGIPVGTVVPYAGTVTPSGFLVCNGSLVSRSAYAGLFAVIGVTYGAGDGSTTFALPDYRGRVLQGASSTHAAGTYVASGMPAIEGSYTANCQTFYAGTGCFVWSSIPDSGAVQNLITNDVYAEGNEPANLNVDDTILNAARSSAVYGGSTEVQPPAVSVQFLIRV